MSGAGAYGRVYDEVLVDEALRERSGPLLGNMETATHRDAVRVLRDIMPPACLQEQTEDNIDRFTAFLRQALENLELYVSMTEPLERVETAALAQVHRFVDELDVAEPGPSGCSLSGLQHLAAGAEPYAQLSQGRLGIGLRAFPGDPQPGVPGAGVRLLVRADGGRPCAQLTGGPGAPGGAGRTAEKLRRGGHPGLPQVGSRPPGAAAGWRRRGRGSPELAPRRPVRPAGLGRAGRSPDLDLRDIEAGAESLRQGLRAVNVQGTLIALAIVSSGILLLALVHPPRPGAMLRWPGVALLAGGIVCLVAGFAVHSARPGLAGESPMSHYGNVPPSAMALAEDVLESFLRQATGGFVPVTAAMMALGAALIAMSLGYGRLSALVGRILPTPEGSGGNEG